MMRNKVFANAPMKDKRIFQFTPRIIRSMESDCWGKDGLSHAELESADKVYTDHYLATAAGHGFDRIWVHVVLRETVPSGFFPKPAPNQLVLLNRLVEKAAKHGIKVIVYLCEPRGLPADSPFWLKHPEAQGRAMMCSSDNEAWAGIRRGFCTSEPSVREFIEESCYNLFKKTPGLGGAFSITASEFVTHCFSHYSYTHLQQETSVIRNYARSPIWQPKHWQQNYIDTIYKLHHLLDESWTCPRCIRRNPSDVVAELITVINRGIKAASPEADVIAWSWAWGIVEPHPQTRLISRLPKDVILMTDWETGGDGQKNVAGRKYPVDEYSLSYIGPCNRFLRHVSIAKRRGMKVMAKLQLAATHELASVPYIPVPFNLAEKMSGLRKYKVDGFLGCWNIGGELSPMTRLAGKMSLSPPLSQLQALRETAAEEFGEDVADDVIKAWKLFSDGWKEYPMSCAFTWNSPINYAPAFYFPLEVPDKPSLCTASHTPLPRDEEGHLNVTSYYLPNWTTPFGVKRTEKALTLLLDKWGLGLVIMGNVSKQYPANSNLLIEHNLACHIALSVKSTINILRFYTLLPQLKAAEENRRETIDALKAILKDEIEIARQDMPLLKADSRLGYHPEAHSRHFTCKDLKYKIEYIRESLRKLK
jgi:hypothetical protein